jgi:succinate-semialdehyde dehydrogenase/glutarate-semialdehyde dehydrogenase
MASKILKNSSLFRTLNPTNNKLEKVYSFLNENEITQLLKASQYGYQCNKKRTFQERALIIENLGKLLTKNAQPLANQIALEIGKPIQYGLQEVAKAANQCAYFAKYSESFLKDTVISTNYIKSIVSYQPTGSIFFVMPWNFPVWLPMKAMIPTLMLGNSTILKPSPTCPGVSLALGELFKEAGFTNNEFMNAFVPVPLMKNIVSSDIVQGVSLTGSTNAGRSFASLAGKYCKKNIMELGGSNPFIVCEDADLDLATKMGALGRLLNTGQVCISSKRFIIQSSIYKEFKEKLFRNIEALNMGDPMQMSTNIGPMARRDLLDTVKGQTLKSINMGAKPIYGNVYQLSDNEDMSKGNFMTPIVLEQIPSYCPLAIEEIFGPVFSLWEVKNDKEAIDLANNTSYGLGSAVFTRNAERAMTIAKQIDAGSVFINDVLM